MAAELTIYFHSFFYPLHLLFSPYPFVYPYCLPFYFMIHPSNRSYVTLTFFILRSILLFCLDKQEWRVLSKSIMKLLTNYFRLLSSREKKKIRTHHRHRQRLSNGMCVSFLKLRFSFIFCQPRERFSS